jgi:uncharacterized protein YndB with AHSA1/START domain
MQPTGDGRGEAAAINLEVTRVFEGSLEELWRCWTESGGVRRWWGPRGFSCPVAEMDVREGGSSLVCMRAPEALGGFEMWCTWTYRAVVPGRRLEFVLRFTDREGTPREPAALGLPPGVPAEVPHELTFRALGEGRAELTLVERGYTSTEAVETSRAGLAETLDKLAALLAGRPS